MVKNIYDDFAHLSEEMSRLSSYEIEEMAKFIKEYFELDKEEGE